MNSSQYVCFKFTCDVHIDPKELQMALTLCKSPKTAFWLTLQRDDGNYCDTAWFGKGLGGQFYKLTKLKQFEGVRQNFGFEIQFRRRGNVKEICKTGRGGFMGRIGRLTLKLKIYFLSN